ncbi:DUF5337 domain-containing protein [Roseicitreum antarcticum]|uniref:DUF5337 domain-containing protein n=1 Tax=Roseicitreum antarcticum TaxID=564137 RepID=A0A1H2ZRI8_9RHOB|nr:DUF5337 domain-containing protein [Roseicitreum antarcticum]SDX20006.1 hypothetical protein SAMN04488238_10641 [Roseicitreum antarcticum]
MVKPPARPHQQDTRQARVVALVLAGTTVVWLVAQWAGGMLGLPGRFAILIDLAALAAFGWALMVTFRLWRKRPKD